MSSTNLQTPSTKLLGLEDDLSKIFHKLNKSRKMVILTGAGISCNAGIPDFRSSEGLYNLSQTSTIKGKDLFDISLFNSDESIQCFAKFMSSLYKETKRAQPTKTHHFIKNQKDKKKLIRCYTQNIDGLESRIGLNLKFNKDDQFTSLQSWKMLDVVQLHGDLNSLSCTKCLTTTHWDDENFEILSNGELPECHGCVKKLQERVELGKRSTGNVGLLRPNIVLYGENHPISDIITMGLNSDLKSKPDFLLIMGTSLKVHGVKSLIRSMSKQIHSKNGIVILVNKDIINGWNGVIDYQIQADCDEFIQDYERFESLTSLSTPPSTPRKKFRIMDVLNTPSPQKKRTFTVYNDQNITTPEESPKKSPRAPRVLKLLQQNHDQLEPITKYIRRSPRLHRIKTLLNDDIDMPHGISLNR